MLCFEEFGLDAAKSDLHVVCNVGKEAVKQDAKGGKDRAKAKDEQEAVPKENPHFLVFPN